jgi:hypothetical protein
MPADLGTTNLWLAIIAVANVITLLALAVAAFVVIRLTKKAGAVVDKVEQQAAPVIARANAIVLEAQHVVDDAKHMVAKVKHANDAVRQTARRQLWPVLGVMRGVSAIASTLTQSNGRPRPTADELARERFMNEGGGSHARERNL